jgi:hypothetical protein
MNRNVLNFLPPKGHRKAVNSESICSMMGPYAIGDGYVVSSGISKTENRSPLWQDGLCVGICQVKGQVSNDSGNGHSSENHLQGKVSLNIFTRCPMSTRYL